MLALALPLICLYFMAGGLATLNDRRRAKKSSNLFTSDGRVSSAQAIDSAAPIDNDD
jgi:hypothetical protein